MEVDILFYIISALLGGLLTWLLFGGKSAELNALRARALKDQEALKGAISELNNFKNNATKQLVAKDTEITKLKKRSAVPDFITKAQDKEIKHWKEKANTIEQQLKETELQLTQKGNQQSSPKLVKELESIQQTLKEKETAILELKQLNETISKEYPAPANTDEYQDLTKKLKKLKKKLKAQKASISEIKTIEIKETINLEKLNKLITAGKLTTKTRKVTRKKLKKKSK